MKIPKLLLILAVLVSSVLSLAAQTNEITEKQFNDIETKSAELLKKSSYRLTRKLEYFADRSKAASVVWETFLEDYLYSDNWHRIFEKFVDRPTRFERTKVGATVYDRTSKDGSKRKDGEWSREHKYQSTFIDDGMELPKFTGATRSDKYLGKVNLDGKQVDLYEIRHDRIQDFPNRRTHSIWKTRYWFDANCKLLKKVEEFETVGKKDLKRETTTIDYDAKFRIVAPGGFANKP